MPYQEKDVRVLGGLPLTVRYSISPAEPDVGLFTDYVDDMYLVDRRGKKASWAEKRMSVDAWEALANLIIEER